MTTLPKRVPGLQLEICNMQDAVWRKLCDDPTNPIIATWNNEISDLMYRQEQANKKHATHVVIQKAERQYGRID